MDDPARLLEGEATDFERSLLAAASSERPDPALVAQMRAGIGLDGTAAVAAGTKASIKLWASLGAVALVGGGIALLALRQPSAPDAVLPAPAPAAAVVAPPPTTPPVEEPATARSQRTALPPAVRRPATGRALTAGPASDLPDEIRRLDRARVALRADNARRALRELDEYAERHPAGALRQEATVLRIEALDRKGERERATAMARAFAAEHPGSPLLERLRRFER